MQMPGKGLERRFQRLRAVVSTWQFRYNQLPDQVVSRFDESDLDSIAKLLVEKRELERLIRDLNEFIRRWEDVPSGLDSRAAIRSGVGGDED
ncbi:hypothetical protein OS242_03315 [Tumebacillus sp. DT12]|uniref:Uncharacterized protein n=1 Tax=Tumebacillus lacus TaxID=2995335 RepID=A0ABT3WXP9_9BACL|nr:hypothetical protein [Tumebacillus lacus]MCX7568991.1 hypothetical protein [Tumebacillus lacus]